MNIVKKNRKNLAFAAILIVLALMPVLMEGGTIKSTTVQFLGKCIAFAIVAISLDLIWGHTGILSLGHGIYFCLGGYAMAMYLKLQATGGSITDFMKTGGLTELPLIWQPFQSIWGTIIMLFIVPIILSGLLGYFIFKNRVKGVYFSIISQALTWAAYSIFIAMSPYTNGNVGITEINPIVGSIRGSKNSGNLMLLFYVVLAIFFIIYVISYFLVKSKFGIVLVAIRDGENRTYFSGYNVSLYKTAIYVFSAVLSAIAGAIFVNFNGSITPSQMTISYSITMVIWVALGGRGTLIGAIIGAFIVNLCEYNMSSGSLVEIWQYIIGGLFVVVILFFKDGLVGLVTKQIPGFIRKHTGKEKGGNAT